MIGSRIRELRQQQGISAQRLSDAVGGLMTRAVIANLENGRKQDLLVNELVAIADALGVVPEQLDERLRGSGSQWQAGYQQAIRDACARISELPG